MSKLKVIHKAIQDILDALPNHSKKVYLLEDYKPEMTSIEIMYDTYYTENKGISLDKNGAYINGRGQGQGDKRKMYFHEFDNIELSKEASDYIEAEKNKITSKLDTRIPTRQIKVGDLCREFIECGDNEYFYVYLGKCEYKHRNWKREEVIINEHIYLNLWQNDNLKDVINSYCSFDECKNKGKIRFDKKISELSNDELSNMRTKFEKKHWDYYGYKWID